MRHLAYVLGLLLALAGCAKKEAAMPDPIIKTAEEGINRLEADPPSGATFELKISDSFTFDGKPDTIGAGMAVLLDKILAAGYEPDGAEQKSGFKIYKYKKTE